MDIAIDAVAGSATGSGRSECCEVLAQADDWAGAVEWAIATWEPFRSQRRVVRDKFDARRCVQSAEQHAFDDVAELRDRGVWADVQGNSVGR